MHIYARRFASIPDFTWCKPDVIMLEGEDWFYYFAYGSNLCAERLKLNNPSAVKVAVARLDDYRLDFNHFSRRWNGAAATIVEDSGNKVWGVVWKLKNSDLVHLDKQEGVGKKIYRRFRVNVNAPDGISYRCWSYQLICPLEEDRRPSTVYKSVIIRGAVENELPEEYIAELRRIPDNGYDGPCEVQLDFFKK